MRISDSSSDVCSSDLLPSRLAVLLLNYRLIASFPFIATTEVSSAHLRKVPGFSSRMIHLKHGAGDREGGYNPRHAAYDLTLVMGEKDRERLMERKLVTAQNCKVPGYSKRSAERREGKECVSTGRSRWVGVH